MAGLKRALEPLLPRAIVHRKQKGFGMPVGRWMQQGKFAMPETTPPGMKPEFLLAKLTAHLEGKSDERLYLWCTWVLGEWMKGAQGSR